MISARAVGIFWESFGVPFPNSESWFVLLNQFKYSETSIEKTTEGFCSAASVARYDVLTQSKASLSHHPAGPEITWDQRK